MQKDSKLFDDIARMASGAAGMVMDGAREAEAMLLAQVEKILARMNLVRREEFEVVREMAANARLEQEKLAARLETLEKQLASESASEKSPKPSKR